jgi:hypothetical protein
MLVPALLVLSLVAGQAEDPYEDEFAPEEESSGSPFLSAWGGNAWDANGGFSAPVLGGEVGWSWEYIDLSLAGWGYKDLHVAGEYSPVVLVRIGQRLRSYRGIEGSLVLGIGASQSPRNWSTFFSFGLGVRVPLGPLILGGEISWEQYNLIRLAGGLGVRF